MKLYDPLRRKRNTIQSAFTLIELVVAIAIILIVFVTIFATMTMGLSITQLSRENLRATQIMLDKMEGVRLYSWDQLTNGTILKTTFVNRFFETNNIETTYATGEGITYDGTLEIVPMGTNMSTTYSSQVRKVNVNVTWTSGNIPRRRSMSTFVSRMGLQNYVYNH
jgi:prepilin-type N-terminal cleavage/methylation domain-containing protein